MHVLHEHGGRWTNTKVQALFHPPSSSNVSECHTYTTTLLDGSRFTTGGVNATRKMALLLSVLIPVLSFTST